MKYGKKNNEYLNQTLELYKHTCNMQKIAFKNII